MTASRTSNGWRSSFIFSTLFSLWASLRNRTYRLPIYPMKATLGLLQVRPPPGPVVLVGRYWTGLGLATDAPVALLEQRVDRNVVLGDVLVNPLLLHESKRGELGRAEAAIPRHNGSVRPLRGLLPADPGHPRVVALEPLL